MNRKYRKTVIAGNWKTNGLTADVKAFALELRKLVPRRQKWCEMALCVPSVIIPVSVRAFRDLKVGVGAQDVSAHESGAYTGEVSAAQLADVGTKYVIVGHSERREYHGETDMVVNKKAHAALAQKLIPIICVGESEEQRDNGLTLDVITLQVKTALLDMEPKQVRRTIFAYEPIWAIGTGKTATAEQAGEVCKAIRAVIRKTYDARVSRGVSILYGGSMNAKNAEELLAQLDIDGGLIGGASLDPEEFAAIVHASNQP